MQGTPGKAQIAFALGVLLILGAALLFQARTRSVPVVEAPLAAATTRPAAALSELREVGGARLSSPPFASTRPALEVESDLRDGLPARPVAGLEVQVLEATTLVPVEHALVTVTGMPGSGLDPLLQRTDAEGRTGFVVPAGLDLNLTADIFRVADTGRVDVRRLRPGEERSIELVLDCNHHRSFLGQVVDEFGFPVARARVKLQRRGLSVGAVGTRIERHTYFEVEPDAAGLFEILGRWQGRVAKVSAPGRARIALRLEEGGHPGAPTLIRIPRGATLRIRIIGAPTSDFRVKLTPVHSERFNELGLHLFRNLVWQAQADDQGLCELLDLPPGVELQSYFVLTSPPHWRWGEGVIVLDPGETRNVEFAARRGY